MARQKLTDGYAERIRAALERGPRPMSIRALSDVLAAGNPGLRGTSYGGVRQYVDGAVRNPRLDLLYAMADALQVRAEWLAFSRGQMTEREEQEHQLRESVGARAVAKQRSEDFTAQWNERIEGGLVEGLGADLDSLPPAIAELIVEVWRVHRWRMYPLEWPADRPHNQPMQSNELFLHTQAVNAREIGQAIVAPLTALGLTLRDLPETQAFDYMLAACQAVRLLSNVDKAEED